MQKTFKRLKGSQKLIKLLAKPFRAELPFLTLALLLISLPTIYFYIRIDCLNYAGYTFMAATCISYLLAFAISITRDRFRLLLRILFSTVIAIHFVFDMFCVKSFQSCLNEDFIAILLGTNPGEITEFFNTFVDLGTIIMIAFSFIVCACLIFLLRKIRLSIAIQNFSVSIVFVFALLSIRNNAVYKDTIAGHLYSLCTIEETPNLREYFSTPSLSKTESRQPQNLVLIIGESFSKYHSSLYGYEKRTNPLLETLRDSSLLFTYDNVKAPALYTIEAFKHFMSTWNISDDPKYLEKKWYTFTTIPEVASLCNYTLYWISNQSKTGLFDNIVGKYADLCDYNMFVGNKYSGMNRKNLDEELLPILRQCTGKSGKEKQKCFYFIHLMGSHEKFAVRYPANRAHFKESEYDKYPISQRKELADYDNSILYNDSVINEIIKQFENKEAVVIYFSDHALDIYQSSSDYCAHAKAMNPKSRAAGEAIPFMIYTSNKYQQAFPKMMQRIKSAKNRKFTTDKLIYTVMDIMGITFASDHDVELYSLFRDKPE